MSFDITETTRIADVPEPDVELVERTCKTLLSGMTAPQEDLALLFGIEPGTEQASLIADTATALARRSNKGRGYIYAQLGIDAGPCPGGCRYCSFAARNGWKRDQVRLSDDDVIRLSSLFAEGGAHLVSLMTSMAVDFDWYLSIVERVHEAIGPDIAIMANTRDLSADETIALREAGASWMYHAVRMGEGIITDLDESERWETLGHAKRAGFALSSAIGPIYQSESPGSDYFQSVPQIMERVERVLAYEPACSGFTRLVSTKGTIMENVRPWPSEKMHVLDDVFQLLARDRLVYGGAGSIKWVDAGLDPRERGYTSEEQRIRKRSAKIREELEASGWEIAPQHAAAALANGSRCNRG